tara:strand:- start:11735 stop:12172 length:438 start_codon:yes stop_codon:yes gene_type:complete
MPTLTNTDVRITVVKSRVPMRASVSNGAAAWRTGAAEAEKITSGVQTSASASWNVSSTGVRVASLQADEGTRFCGVRSGVARGPGDGEATGRGDGGAVGRGEVSTSTDTRSTRRAVVKMRLGAVAALTGALADIDTTTGIVEGGL